MPAPADDQLQQDPSRQPHEPVDPHEPSDAVAQAFDQVCSRLGGFDDVIHTEWVDGYLTALAASWRVIGLDEALPLMCGDAFERAFADPPDAALARAALQARLDELRVQLDPEALLDDADRLRLAPMMVLWDDTARQEVIDEGLATEEVAAQLHTGASWAVGFFRALDDFADDWPEPGRDIDDELVEVYESLLETVAILEDDPDSEPFRAFAAEGWTDANPTREELVNEACFAVQDLRIWWMDHRPKRAPLRAAAVPGRNDPCPCGSGKKYKKCCGA